MRVSKNADVMALREAIDRVVDDHGCRAGAQRMAARSPPGGRPASLRVSPGPTPRWWCLLAWGAKG